MNKFKPGDRVELINDGVRGEVVEVEMLEGNPSYEVQWDDDEEGDTSTHWEEDLKEAA